MRGSTTTKIANLGWHLLRRPGYLWRYVSTIPARGISPIDLGMPWISFPAIDFLANWVSREHRVFEWGSGGSTLFFANRAGWVVSMEHDAEWHARVKVMLKERQIENVDLRLAPFEVGNAPDFGETEYLSAVRGESWDLILVDGVVGYGSGGDFGTHRQTCFHLAEKHIRPGGVIMVDDMWMFPELQSTNRAKSWQAFVGVGPCRSGVTSTAAFFY
jgi:Methyltransferase domain